MKYIVITGASKGIGHKLLSDLVATLPESDYRIIHISRTPSKLLSSSTCTWIEADLSTEEGLLDCQFRLTRQIEEEELVVLVNNAGAMPLGQSFTETTFKRYNEVMDLNLKAVFFMCKFCIPLMLDGGRIVNVSSTSGVRAEEDEHIVPYGVAKAGVIMLTKYLARLYPRLCINSVSPGFVAPTELVPGETPKSLIESIPKQREATTGEISSIIQYLCFGDSDYITGQNFVIDGGSSL